MLRPATPLSVVLFIAFCLLLISVLSTPIINVIPLGNFRGVNFGVFGFCKPNGCSPIEIGYDTSQIFSPDDSATFDLPSSARTTLSAILVFHPVAALLTLVQFVLAVISHLHGPSHSAKFLLWAFITSILNFLICLIAFLVDVLLFVPHMAWGSYLVLAATILTALSTLVSCAMRRTIVSRKARKKRIAENAEMSGENYYNRQAQQSAAVTTSGVQPTVPLVSGANGTGDQLPEFASFEKKYDRSSDERIPLTARSPSERSPNNLASDIATGPVETPYLGPNAPSRSRTSPGPPDQYSDTAQGLPDGYAVRRAPSLERLTSRGRGGVPPGGYRGRGGGAYGPPAPGRGGYNGYGTPPLLNGRGGYGPPGRGGYGHPGGRRGYGPPPRGYGGPGMRGGRSPPPQPGYQGAGPYDRRDSPAGAYPGPYDRQPSPGPGAGPGYMNAISSVPAGRYDACNQDRSSLPRAESPPPLPGVDDVGPPGHAVEMDASTASPSVVSQGFDQFGIRDSDADVAGMLALQQAKAVTSHRHDTYMSDVSNYSQEESAYVPPRQHWNQGAGRNSPRVPSPLNMPSTQSVEVYNRGSPAPVQQPPAGEYYEDVDPRFAEPPTAQRQAPLPIKPTNSYGDIPQGALSPAESERSNFTSISQRGINPRWNPHPLPPPAALGYGQSVIPRRPLPRDDMVLNSNADFELPGARAPPERAGGPGVIPGSAYPPGHI